MAENLLSNAVKFTPAGGSVTLETGVTTRTAEAGAGQEARQVAMLRVSDTGIGIPADELPYVSQRFFRGKRASDISGSGIGLAIVDQLARLHHGRMEIASQARPRHAGHRHAADGIRSTSMKAPHPAHPDCIRTGFPPTMDIGGYLVTLEDLWRQKVDQIVVLSMAYHDDIPADTVHALTSRQNRSDTLLMNRVMRAHEDLALIEDAIDRIKAGTYGICGTCAQPISADWLNQTPYVRDCPVCCLSQTNWQPAVAARAAGTPAIAS